MERIEVKECQKYLLQLAKTFHKICVRNSIPYYMIGGTQLGAIRHKGFIPWDDDMDFGIPRKFYKNLLDILEKELPPEYKVISLYNTPTYTNGFFKIEDSRTLIKEVNSKGLKIGLNIDVFPIDYCNDNKGLFSKNWWIVQLDKLETYSFVELEKLGWLRMIANFALRRLSLFKDNKSIYSFIDKHLIEKNGDYWVNHYGAYANKEVVPIEMYGTPTLYTFEDTEFYGVEQFDRYLGHFYGDYMQLPKDSARHFHIEELFLR